MPETIVQLGNCDLTNNMEMLSEIRDEIAKSMAIPAGLMKGSSRPDWERETDLMRRMMMVRKIQWGKNAKMK